MRFNVGASFGRMLAKIGYGHILTQLDIGDFEPFVMPQILGSNLNVSYLVGCNGETKDPEEGVGYKLETVLARKAEEVFIIADVRLLANCRTPTYSVVVGRTTNVESTRAAIEKLGTGEFIVGSTSAG